MKRGRALPAYEPADVQALARWVHARCGRPLCAPAVHLATVLGVAVVDTGEGSPAFEASANELRFRRHRNPRVEGGRQWLALARCLLLRAGCSDHETADLRTLAGALALPVEQLPDCRTLRDAMRVQPSATRRLLREQLAAANT